MHGGERPRGIAAEQGDSSCSSSHVALQLSDGAHRSSFCRCSHTDWQRLRWQAPSESAKTNASAILLGLNIARYLRSDSDSFMIFTLEMFTPQGGNSFGVKKLSDSFE